MKTIILTVIMIMLFSTVAFATTAYTEYEGMGDFEMTTTLISPISPDITDSVAIYTGCAGDCPCCCYPNIFGGYSGTQVVSNNPFVASGHKADVTDGCISIDQYYIDYLGDQTIYTSYYTYFNGTGTAESYVFVVPGEAVSYQLANGTGTSFVSFGQIAYIGTEPDFSTTYGGGVWACAPGYAEMIGSYYYHNQQVYYNNELELYCYPVGENNLNAFLFTSSTDFFGLFSSLSTGYLEFSQEISVEGTSDYGFSVNSTDDIDFDFEMELG
jgi:hypothetical protein